MKIKKVINTFPTYRYNEKFSSVEEQQEHAIKLEFVESLTPYINIHHYKTSGNPFMNRQEAFECEINVISNEDLIDIFEQLEELESIYKGIGVEKHTELIRNILLGKKFNIF